jgi:hypothetical protein
MARKLNTHVHVDGKVYGPDDDVPADVAKQITNPDVWDGGDADGNADSDTTGESGDTEVVEPPRGGPGSSVSAWTEFAQSKNLDVPAGASAKDIQALWDARNQES